MKSRQGLTLLEVVISLAIFLVSMAGLYQVIQFTSDRAVEIDRHSQASLYCQSKLAEIACGFVSMESTGWAALDESTFQYKVDVITGDIDGVNTIQVSVKDTNDPDPESQVTLSQMVMDPTRRGSTLDPLAPATPSGTIPTDTSAAGASTGVSGSTGAGTGTGGGTGGGGSAAKGGGTGTPTGGGASTGGKGGGAPTGGGSTGGKGGSK